LEPLIYLTSLASAVLHLAVGIIFLGHEADKSFSGLKQIPDE
jgi:hypothetical protein